MSSVAMIRGIAEVTWESMRAHAIAPTPRNYEIWYAYCSAEKPALIHRLNGLLRAGHTMTPGLLDELYRDFFSVPLDVSAIRDGSNDLRQIAAEIAERVMAERSSVESFGSAITRWSAGTRTVTSTDELRRAAATLGDASVQMSQRLRALEQLLAASVARIGELKDKLAKAEQDATQDALTGLANRRHFDTTLRDAAGTAEESGSDLALLLLDIDHFKRFNDAHGHTLGDNVLRLVARVLMDHIKGRDTAARHGGEEFAIILPGANLAGGIAVAEQVRQTLERRPIINRSSGRRLGVVTCSIGVAHYRRGEKVGELIDRADKALYIAKRDGRNAVRAENALAPAPA
jgi:diguanylate cyclase